jgi:hypothetical protein
MDWRIFLYRSSVTTSLPFDVLVNYLKRKTSDGVRFKLGYIDKEDIDIYYSNDYAYGGYYERLGLDRVPNMQVITNDKMVTDGQVTIKFQTANFVLVIFGLIGTFILCFGIFIVPTIGLIGPSIVLFVLYLLTLNDFTKQLSYFKYDLGLMEKDYRARTETKTE